MITFILYALSAILNEPVPGTVYWLTGLVDGLVFLPLMTLVFVPVMGRITREKIGRLHYLQSVFPMEDIVLVLSPWGYEFAPVRSATDDDGEPIDIAVLADGQHVELGEARKWYRLGGRRLGVAFVPDRRVLADVVADPEDIELETIAVEGEDGEETRYLPAVFGDRGVLTKRRGGFRGWTPVVDAENPPNGFITSLSKAINSLREGGGIRLSEHTEKMTRIREGGGAQVTDRAKVVAYVSTVLIASVLGVVVLGVL